MTGFNAHKYTVAAFFFTVLFFPSCSTVDYQYDTTLSNKIDEYINSFNCTVTEYQINGSILISKSNRILYYNSFGKADYEGNRDFNEGTVYRLASITKLFTALAVMQLYEKGKLDLIDPIGQYFPDQFRGDDITIHHLLTHTSGIQRESGVNAYLHNTKENIIGSIVQRPLLFEPGTEVEYSNAGYNLLAAVVEKVSGMTYRDYLKKYIFQPASMKNTGCDSGRDTIPNLAAGYRYQNGAFKRERELNLSFAYGAGEIYSTALDMFNFDRALHSGRLISEPSLKSMFKDNTDFVKYGDLYGYGANVNDLNNNLWYGKSGNLLSFSSYYIRFPKAETTIIILLNTWFPIIDQLKSIISAIALNEPYTLPERKREIALEEKVLQTYQGRYQSEVDTFMHLKTGRYIDLTIDGNHLVDRENEGYPLEFIPFARTEFYTKGLEFLECFFHWDGNGNIIGLTITNGTQKVFFKKESILEITKK